MDRLDGCRNLSGVAGMEHGQGSLNISDVIEVIQTTDPEFGVDTMYPGGTVEDSRKKSAYVKILEQPASKALRFRYECEGRSAGSIPGVNSTPENKTFPTIQIVGYKGPAVVVVSCVTKDPPHRPHPHNLVGKEGCKKGICTMRINSDTMTVSFSNLGIQCVKKKDIEDALKVREEIRVDPFHTGFSHRSQHTSIDLNAVRLCFQVFLEDEERERFTLPLAPVVSEPIFDKKAMSDLVICKLSDCSCTVAGGKEIILLCEKVAKEDIQVYFYEEKDGNEVWNGLADFQPTHVHKQVAISFRTPSYKTLHVDSPVTVNIQLRRPSDGATSEPLPFQYHPIDSGRPAFWSLRKALSKKGNYSMFSSILASNTALLTGGTTRNNLEPQGSWTEMVQGPEIPSVNGMKAKETEIKSDMIGGTDVILENVTNVEESEAPKNESNNNEVIMIEDLGNDRNKKSSGYNYAEINKWNKANSAQVDSNANIQNENEKDQKLVTNENEEVETCRSLNELLSQVAELDEIYSDTRARLLSQGIMDTPAQDITAPQIIEMDVEDLYDDDDNQTYSSLQLAMKNPIELLDLAPGRYEDVMPQGNKRDQLSDSKLPPLPPKRIRRSPPTPPARPIHPIFPREAPEKNLPPPPPEVTPPKQAKPTLFQKLFSKKPKQDTKKDVSREGSVDKVSEPPVIRIESEPASSTPQAELTEAEHYALYTDMAPHATASEFDEMSFYYSPVEGGNIITPGENVINKMSSSNRDIFT